jgi:hypothetical protein
MFSDTASINVGTKHTIKKMRYEQRVLEMHQKAD